MKPKILFTASIAKHILRFHLPYLKWFQEQGYETHVACEGDEEIPYCDKKWHIPFIRSPYSPGHIKAYKKLKKLLDNEYYTLIHCHTPMASIVTRMAARKTRKKGTKVLYTAHGFHFFKGSPAINWLTFYPIEVLSSKWADAIITINKEDLALISKKGHSKTSYFQIPGIGVRDTLFQPVDKEKKATLRKKYNLAPEDFILVYAAEFIPRKNHQFIINAAKTIKEHIPNIKILFAGRGVLKEPMEKLAQELSVEEVVKFLGFCDNIHEIYQLSDVGISASKQEGLGLNLAEEMMCELPIVATKDRGHNEMIIHGKNGFLFEQNDQKGFVEYINKVYKEKELYKSLSKEAAITSQHFSLNNSLKTMAEIYNAFLSSQQN